MVHLVMVNPDLVSASQRNGITTPDVLRVQVLIWSVSNLNNGWLDWNLQ